MPAALNGFRNGWFKARRKGKEAGSMEEVMQAGPEAALNVLPQLLELF